MGKSKKTLENRYTLPILVRIRQGQRPSQIARSLKMTNQNIYHYTSALRATGILAKVSASGEGIRWTLTELGHRVLKLQLSRTVNSVKGGRSSARTMRPVLVPRFHASAFAFPLVSVPESLDKRAEHLKNGVLSLTDKRKGRSIQLFWSRPAGWRQGEKGVKATSVIIVHVLTPEYCSNVFRADITQYNRARVHLIEAQKLLGIEAIDFGQHTGKPHMAFESDPVAQLLAKFETFEVETPGGGKVWVDGSHDRGEIETDDAAYEAKFVLMPEIVSDTHSTVTDIHDRMTAGYKRDYDPALTINN